MDLTRADLCTIGRELMLAAHLQDRVGIPAVLRRHTMDEANQLAIDEWMTASPIYTRRMQRLLGFEGDDVGTIFKGLQLDVGAPHQFLDFGFELHDAHHGEFWLRSCGALADVAPLGEDMVRGMCHDIEDPTFDATAVATNPRARVRPVHRPPVVPRGGPDCHWTVTIDPDGEPVAPHPHLEEMAGSVVAQLPNRSAPDGYAGPFDPHFELEHLSPAALETVLREFAIQGHVLARSMMTSVARRHGADEAIDVGRSLFTGIGWIASERMARALEVEATDPDALVTVLPLTHLLHPADYVGLTVERDGDTTVIALADDASGLAEGDPYSLPGLLALGASEIVESLVHGVDPTASVAAAGRTWVVTPGEVPADEPPPVTVARFSTGVNVTLRRRVPLP